MIIYDSRASSGTTKYFAKQLAKCLGVKVYSVTDILPTQELPPYILCTYTIGYGEIPETTQAFLYHHAEQMQGVVANGSSNFRATGMFGKAGERIATIHQVPSLGVLDMGGTREDLERISKRAANLLQTGRVATAKEVRPFSLFENGRFKLKPLQ